MNLEGSGRDINVVLSQCLPGESEENVFEEILSVLVLMD
jgi:hypothetical protein